MRPSVREDFERLRDLLIAPERARLQRVDARLQKLEGAQDGIPDRLAHELKSKPDSAFAQSLSRLTVDSLDVAVHERPQAVVDALYPVIGATIRRSTATMLQQFVDDLDRTLRSAFSWRSLRWRLEAWRSGVPYARVVLRHTTRCQVEYLFWITPESGLLQGHLRGEGVPELDADAVAGMFSAINHFVRDSLAAGDGAPGLGHAQLGDYRLAVSHGPRAWLVAFIHGAPSGELQTRLEALNELLHRTALRDDTARALTPAHLDMLNDAPSPTTVGRGGSHWRAVIVLVAVAALAVWQIASSIAWSARLGTAHRALEAVPGLEVMRLESPGRGHIVVTGLLDPDADDPRPGFDAAHPGVEADWHLTPYLSMAPEIVRRRTARQLQLPIVNVGVPDATGRITLVGEVPFATWYGLREPPLLAGTMAPDVTELHYPGQADIEAGVARIEALAIEFDTGTSTPAAGMQVRLDALRAQLRALQDLARPHGVAFRFQAMGSTDEPGAFDLNQRLREQRATWLAIQIMDILDAPSQVGIDPLRLPIRPGHDQRSAALTVHPIPVEQ